MHHAERDPELVTALIDLSIAEADAAEALATVNGLLSARNMPPLQPQI